MKKSHEFKAHLQISEVNQKALDGAGFIASCEEAYDRRVTEAAETILKSGCHAVMVSGPSASGKTTSSKKLALKLASMGKYARVVSLDDFFKNVEEYPLTHDGKPDFESIHCLDIDLINKTLKKLLDVGEAVFPQFDFVTQHRKAEGKLLSIGKDAIVIVEGIHALNPLLSDSLSTREVFRLYAGLRAEYYEGEERRIPSRDLRIVRRMVRDHFFRGYSVNDTLDLWDNLLAGEDRWIRVFKKDADLHLDTSYAAEGPLFSPFLEELYTNGDEKEHNRHVFGRLVTAYKVFAPLSCELLPRDSLLREFLGGLVLPTPDPSLRKE